METLRVVLASVILGLVSLIGLAMIVVVFSIPVVIIGAIAYAVCAVTFSG